MKLFIASVLVLSMVSLGIVGCGEKSSTTEKTKVTTPGEATTATAEKEVKKTADNPRPVKP